MRYQVRTSYVSVIGRAWGGFKASMDYDVSDAELTKLGPDPSKAELLEWARKRAGDFASVDDLSASLSYPDGRDITIDLEEIDEDATYTEDDQGNWHEVTA